MKITVRVASQAVLMLAVATMLSASTTTPVDWVVGDVFIATGNGQYQVWHSTNPASSAPSYTNSQLLNEGVGGATAGCTFDSAYRLFTTNFINSEVVRFSIDGTISQFLMLQRPASPRANRWRSMAMATSLSGMRARTGLVRVWRSIPMMEHR